MSHLRGILIAATIASTLRIFPHQLAYFSYRRIVKSAVLVTFVVLLFGCGCIRREASILGVELAEPVTVSNLEFGEQWARPDFTWNLQLHNNAADTLTVKVLGTSCHCTVNEVSTLTLPPQGDGSLPLKIDLTRAIVDTDSTAREFSVAVWASVVSDRDPPHRATWNVRGTVRPLFQLSPSVVRFDDLPRIDCAKPEADVRSVEIRSFAPLTSIHAVSANGRFECQIAPAEDGDPYRFVLAVRPVGDLLRHAGHFREIIALRPERGDGLPLSDYTLPVTGRVVDDLKAVPESLHFGPRPVGETVTDYLSISSRDGRPIKILDISQDNQNMSADLIASEPTADTPQRNLKVSVHVGADGLQKLELTVSAAELTASGWVERRLVVPVLYHGLSESEVVSR
ncbi:MAG: hypothetical protein AB7U20_16275 [Planctomycetaceae bacterium]